jgi:ADP-heptose:LPS heptosyltransferase
MLRRNILIFQTGGLGDFILTWPFAVGLGRIYPQSRIIYVTHSQKGELAKRVLRLEATDAEAGWHGLFADGGRLPAAAQAMLESAHSVYSFLPVSPVWHQSIERINPHAKRVEIDVRITPEYRGHVTDRMIEQLQNYPPERAATEQILRSIADRGIGFKPAGGADVVIHPGAGSPAKCWPINRYIELAEALKSSVRSVNFVVGEVERDRWKQNDLNRLAAAGRVRSCGNLLELLNEISTAGCFVGNDSGPSHLAGIIGIPTLALFGPTDPLQWKPLGQRVAVLRHEPIEGIEIPQILESLAPIIAI